MEKENTLTEISKDLNSPKRHKVLLIILGILITLFGTFALTLAIYTWDRGLIAKGVVISGIPLGQLRLEDAQAKLEENRKEILNCPVHFATTGKTVSISKGELGLTDNYDEVFRQAHLIGRKGLIFERAYSKFKASWGISLDPHYQWNDQMLRDSINKNIVPLNSPAKNARFTITPDSVMDIVPEKLGKQVDIDTLIASVKNLPLTQSETIPIPYKDILPTITKAELEDLKMAGLLSSYTTYFNPNQIGRTENIRLAAKAIDLTVLKPEEEFSFNQIVGERTIEAGYQMAIIIEGDQFVPGLGGGVCQVSSTLYNAVQQANLTVSERSRHTIAITYVPPGQDATVAYPNLDFKFKNNSGGNLLIRSKVAGDSITFSIYGK
ncbi:MAG TPA: VanW family protein [Desulfosporosinus sp.]|nr:VanW family protein [Desulfosporosinus sp.]